jgi:hypothetical protein
LEALEDCFWESTFSSFAQDDYLASLNNFSNSSLLKKQEELYNTSTRSHNFKNSKLYKQLNPNGVLNSLPLFSKEGFLNSPLIAKKNFISVYNESTLDSIDESYESLKNFTNSLSGANKFLVNVNSYSLTPHSYTRVLDPFRADYEEIL